MVVCDGVERLCQAVLMIAEDDGIDAGRWPRIECGTVRRSSFIVTSFVRSDLEIAMAIDGHAVVELRGTALELWRLTLQDVRIDVLIEQLADTYHAEPTAIAPDVMFAVDRLLSEGLLELVQA